MLKDDILLEKFRNEINAIDYKIHDLINERAKIALEIGKIKVQKDGPTTDFYRPEREKQILDRISEYNKGPLNAKAIHNVFKIIMQECLILQERTNKVMK
jgi:chorismate mutase / prephenate dehydratase